MKIVVCVKHVPGEQSDRRIDATGRIVRGEEDVLSELDENAVEAAVRLGEQLVEAGRDAEVVAVTLGPAGAVAAARRALQMGAARGVHVLDDRAASSDVVATARILAAAARHVGADGGAAGEGPTGSGVGDAGPAGLGDVGLVVTGMASMDGMTSLLPAALAAVLGVPALTNATDVTLSGGELTVRRDVLSADEVFAAPLPAVLSVTDQANSPRYPNMKALLAAKKKPVATVSLEDLGLAAQAPVGATAAGVRVVAAEAVPPRVAGEIVADSGDGGRRLAQWLTEHDLTGTEHRA